MHTKAHKSPGTQSQIGRKTKNMWVNNPLKGANQLQIYQSIHFRCSTSRLSAQCLSTDESRSARSSPSQPIYALSSRDNGPVTPGSLAASRCGWNLTTGDSSGAGRSGAEGFESKGDAKTFFALDPSPPTFLLIGESSTLGYRVNPSKAPKDPPISSRLPKLRPKELRLWCLEGVWNKPPVRIDHGFDFGVAKAPNLRPLEGVVFGSKDGSSLGWYSNGAGVLYSLMSCSEFCGVDGNFDESEDDDTSRSEYLPPLVGVFGTLGGFHRGELWRG